MTARTSRLGPPDAPLAKRLFGMMARVFGEPCDDLPDSYVEGLLSDRAFWVLAALEGEDVVGGLTAHTLPMTRKAGWELFVYDVAVREDRRRMGIGRQLIARLRTDAGVLGIEEVFVLADAADAHALDFYRALGGSASSVTLFAFAP